MAEKTTHFVPYDAPGTRLARARCGRLVDPRTEHSKDPTCSTCARLQAEDATLVVRPDTVQ
jgi:hypothetical protein